jgi:hypothetical protein
MFSASKDIEIDSQHSHSNRDTVHGIICTGWSGIVAGRAIGPDAVGSRRGCCSHDRSGEALPSTDADMWVELTVSRSAQSARSTPCMAIASAPEAGRTATR